MCMKYVNCTVQCFDKGVRNIFAPMTFSSIIGSVESKEKNGSYYIDGFTINTFINIRGTGDGNNPNNPLDMKKTLDFRIRLTKMDPDINNRLSYDLKNFRIDLSNQDIIKKACFPYVDIIDIIDVKGVSLQSKGNYVIKVLIKESNESLFDVQMLHPFTVN